MLFERGHIIPHLDIRRIPDRRQIAQDVMIGRADNQQIRFMMRAQESILGHGINVPMIPNLSICEVLVQHKNCNSLAKRSKPRKLEVWNNGVRAEPSCRRMPAFATSAANLSSRKILRG